MADKKYNGWTNYETWSVALLIDNDAGSQEYWNERAKRAWENSKADVLPRSENAATRLARELETDHIESMEDFLEESGQQVSLWSQLLHASLSDVDWYEIAENLLDSVNKKAKVSR